MSKLQPLLTPGKRQIQLYTVLLFGISALLFLRIFFMDHPYGDLLSHVDYARAALKGQKDWPTYFLYFGMVTSTSWFAPDTLWVWNVSATFWLSLMVCGKMLATFWFLHWHQQRRKRPVNGWALAPVAFLLAFVFSIPALSAFQSTDEAWGFWYRHSFTPNVWHNSTLIALMPFAVLTFLFSQWQLEGAKSKNTWWLTATTVVSGLAKPSFLMSWLPTYGLVAFFNRSSLSRKCVDLLPVAAGLGIIALQYVLIFQDADNIKKGTEIQVGYLSAWLGDAKRTEWGFYQAIVLSSFFPIAVYASQPQLLRTRLHIQALIMCFFSHLFTVFLTETGKQAAAGNFMWSIISAQYILYMVCAADFFFGQTSKKLKKPSLADKRYAIPLAIFAVQVTFGFAYLARYAISGRFH